MVPARASPASSSTERGQVAPTPVPFTALTTQHLLMLPGRPRKCTWRFSQESGFSLYLLSTSSPSLSCRAWIPLCPSQFQGAFQEYLPPGLICSLDSNARNTVLGTGSGRELVKDRQRREPCPIFSGFVSLRVGSLEETQELVVGERALPRLLHLGSRNAPAPVQAELQQHPLPAPPNRHL